ncbi:MAG TPA: hypothetical protein VFX88_20795 [Actinomycetota bacterium]|jgi:hypothetical protein|nr:hypothetical protein [Actinomycetota bacterium]
MSGRDLPDLDQRLRRLPAALAVDAPAGLAERIAQQGRRRRWLRRATAAAAVVVLLGGVAVTRSLLAGQPTPVLNPGLLVQDPTPAQLAAGRWEALPPMPATEPTRRLGPAVVWTGRQLIVWGGGTRAPTRALADGAAYDPATRRWTSLPPAPEGQWLLGEETAVWTGRELLVWGGLTFPDPVGAPGLARRAAGVAYDPARRSWRLLPPLPAQLRALTSEHWTAWTGRELLVGGLEEAEAGGVTVAGYDPAANRWRRLPPSPGLTRGPGHLQARSAVWAGSRLLVWSFWSDTARAATDESGVLPRPDPEPDGIDVWAYDPASDRWTVLPPPPAEARRAVVNGSMTWTGRDLLLVAPRVERMGGRDRATTVAGRYDPERAQWTPIAPLPLRSGGRLDLARAGETVVEPFQRAVYDPASDRWSRLPARPDPAGTPPLGMGNLERTLLWTVQRAAGAVQVYVLVPGRP